MTGYWWQCEKCGTVYNFPEVSDTRGIAHFIWDVLIPSEWDQQKLSRYCKNCNSNSLRITYEFPRRDKVTLKVIRIIGRSPKDKYVPMMWETNSSEDESINWFDFKYVNGRNVYGLNKPAVFTRNRLKQLFEVYCQKTGTPSFP